ncbi:MAG: DegV family protein [Dehalococcoidia bacterium]
MPKTIVVTDSSTCLPAALRTELGIVTVPLGLLIGEEVYPDGSLTSGELFRLAEAARTPVRTATPTPGEFLSAFGEAREAGADSVLCLTLAASFSSTYESAVAAQALAIEELPDFEVRVVDSGGLAMTHGFAVLAAARTLAARGSLDDAAAAASSVGGRGRLAGLLGTTLYLARGGRVPWILHWAANVLRIRPLLAYEGGRAHSIGQVRTERRGLERLVAFAQAHQNGGHLRVAVMHTEAAEAAERLSEAICRELAPAELVRTDFTAVMAAHTGPGFVGLAFYEDD